MCVHTKKTLRHLGCWRILASGGGGSGGGGGGVGGGTLIPTGSNSRFEEWLQNYAKLMHQAVSTVFDTFGCPLALCTFEV